MTKRNKISKSFPIWSKGSIIILQFSKYKITIGQDRRFFYVKEDKMLSRSLEAEALAGLMMGQISLETSPKNIMIQDMINSKTAGKLAW